MIRLVSYMIVCVFTSLAVASAQAADAGRLTFEDAAGHSLSLDDFKGKPVIINLWASWCEPCVAEMPSLTKMQQDFAGKGLVVLALSEDDSPADAAAFYKKAGITSLTPYFDRDHAAWHALHVNGIPASIFIDRGGNAVQVLEGALDWQSPNVEQAITSLFHYRD